jgi:hypothetical protein
VKTASCRDLEKALASENPALTAAFETHASGCAACSRELAEWRQISAGAPSLRKSWDSPQLWPTIHQALAEESQRAAARPAMAPPGSGLRWLPAAAIVALFAVATAGLWAFRNSGGREPLASRWQTTKDPLLTERAIEEVDAAEKAYLSSIDKLSKLAEPRLAAATSPVMLNYREKLALLDSAIAELQAGIEQNRFNTHLRRELVAMYREKQQTLQNLMKEGQS